MPTVEFAVAVTLAMPEAFVVAVAEDSVALAPDRGTANVTAMPGTGLFEESFTITCSAEPKAVATSVVCADPPDALMLAGAPAVLVRLKLTGVATPATEAVTA